VLRKSCSRMFARSPVTGGTSELIEVVALPGSTLWSGGGGASSLLVPRPDSTMKGRLCCTYSGGYASIATVQLLQGHEDAGGQGRFAEVLRGMLLPFAICAAIGRRHALWWGGVALKACLLERQLAQGTCGSVVKMSYYRRVGGSRVMNGGSLSSNPPSFLRNNAPSLQIARLRDHPFTTPATFTHASLAS